MNIKETFKHMKTLYTLDLYMYIIYANVYIIPLQDHQKKVNLLMTPFFGVNIIFT